MYHRGNGKNIQPGNLALVNIQRKQQRIFERNRLIRTYYYTYDEFVQEGVEESVNPFCKQVTQFSLDVRKIKTFPSIKAAAITLKMSENPIINVLKGRQVSGGGFLWRYGKIEQVDMKSLWEKKKLKYKKERGQKVSQFDLKGKKVAVYLAIADAGRATGIHHGDISATLSGKQRTAGDFIWKKGWGKDAIDIRNFVHGVAWRAQKQRKKVNQYTPEGKYIRTFASVKEAAAFVGVNDSAISIACKHRHRMSGGYKWEFG